MTYLILRANYNNENRGDEYSPTHFILDVDPPIVKLLRNFIKSVNSLKENPSGGISLIECSFYFGFGLWTEWNEVLVDLAQEEITWLDNLDSYFENEDEIQEQQYLSEGRISVDKEGNFQFFCFGKYDGEKIYTCSVNIFEIQEHLGSRLLESI